MAATPQYGTMILRGLRTTKTYVKDIYVSDVDNALVNFDGGGGANSGSPTEFTPPEPVILTDFSIVTGTVDTTKLQLIRNGQPTGDMLRYSIHLTTLSNRPNLVVGISAGARFSCIQRA